MEIKVDGRPAALAAGPGTPVGRILEGIRHWVETSGRRIRSVVLDGREIRESDLERQISGEPGDGPVLEIATEDPDARVLSILRKAADVLPGARLDLGFAARCLRSGEVAEGLEALFQAIRALGVVESALRVMAATAGHPPSSGAALSDLRGFLGALRDALHAQDLDQVAGILREDGLRVVSAANEHIQTDIEHRLAARGA